MYNHNGTNYLHRNSVTDERKQHYYMIHKYDLNEKENVGIVGLDMAMVFATVGLVK